MSRIEQHRRVYAVFGTDIGGPIHALSLVTKAEYVSETTNPIRDEIQRRSPSTKSSSS